MPLVSVVLPTYNRADLLLNRSLPSVLSQTHRDLEVLIVGDGTDDATREALWGFTDARVRFFDRPRQMYPEDPGQAWCVLGLEARNYGMDQARGEWIAPLDDDDAWTPDHLEVLLREAEKGPYDIVYSRSEAYWQDGRTTWYGNWPPGHFQYCCGSEIIRASMQYRYDPACIERGLPEDGDLIDRMVADKRRFGFVNRTLHYYWPHRQ